MKSHSLLAPLCTWWAARVHLRVCSHIEPRKATWYSMSSNDPWRRKVVRTRRTSRRRGWPIGFGALSSSPYSLLFTSASQGSRPRSYLFTSVTGRIGVHTAPKYGAKPIQYVTLDFRDWHGTSSLRHRNRTATAEPISGMVFVAEQKLSSKAWT